MAFGKAWTEEENEILEKMYGSYSFNQIAKKVNRTPIAVKGKAKRLGLGGLPLKFDFAIFDKENNLIFQLEYDGEFHYFPIMGQARLDRQQEHDRRKDEYCKLYNIDLLRIPYWEFDNIDKILNEKLNIKQNKKGVELIHDKKKGTIHNT